MTKLTFDQVWSRMKELEGKTVPTLVFGSQNRIIRFTATGMLRQVKEKSGRLKNPTEVPKRAFQNLWNALSSGQDVEVMNERTWRIAAACIVAVKTLGVAKIADHPLTLRLYEPVKRAISQ